MTSLTPPPSQEPLDDQVLEEAGLLLQEGQATERMERSVHKFAQLLLCPLCNKIFKQPTTLSSCAHSFCVGCIDAYARKKWNCPVEGCNMPIAVVGGHGGSYRKINPQLSQTLESLQLICESLNKSPKEWWKSTETLASLQAMLGEPSQEEDNDDNHDCDDDDDDDGNSSRRSIHRNMNDDNLDEENMIDLQADGSEDEHRFHPTTNRDNDNDDCLSIDSDDSLWNRSSRDN